MSATRVTRGASCLSTSSHLLPISGSNVVNPVILPPGCARPATKPLATGSSPSTNTIGTDGVSRFQGRDDSCAIRQDHVWLKSNYFRRVGSRPICVTADPVIVDLDIGSFGPPCCLKPLAKGGDSFLSFQIVGDPHQHDDPRQSVGLLCARHERPRCRTAKREDEISALDLDCQVTLPWEVIPNVVGRLPRFNRAVCGA